MITCSWLYYCLQFQYCSPYFTSMEGKLNLVQNNSNWQGGSLKADGHLLQMISLSLSYQFWLKSQNQLLFHQRSVPSSAIKDAEVWYLIRDHALYGLLKSKSCRKNFKWSIYFLHGTVSMNSCWFDYCNAATSAVTVVSRFKDLSWLKQNVVKDKLLQSAGNVCTMTNLQVLCNSIL